jgi:DNA gyrase subunit A
LAKSEARAHILEGLLLALNRLDEIIALIRASRNPAEAKSGLIANFGLTDLQAQAILDLRLQKLTQLERQAIVDEHTAAMKDIERFKAILGSETLLLEVIKDEFIAIKSEYGDERRTQITQEGPLAYNPEDLIAEEQMVVTITHNGYIKRTPLSSYKTQKRGGKGLTGAKTKEDDFVERMYIASTHSYLLFFTNKGRLYWLKVHELPLAARATKGKALINIIPFVEGEKVNTVLDVGDLSEKGRFVIMATRAGIIKRVDVAAFQNPRKAGIIAITLKSDEDELVSAALTDGKSAVVLSTWNGKAICCNEEDIRSMGRSAAGVKGIKLGLKDRVVGMDIISLDGDEVLMTVTEKGYGKRTNSSEYTLQKRGGQGTRTTTAEGGVVRVFKVTENDQLMLITNSGRLILFKVSEVRMSHRNTHGVKLMGLDPEEMIVDVAPLAISDESDDSDESGEDETDLS